MGNKIFIFVLLVFIAGCSDIPIPRGGSSTDKSSTDESKKIGNRITSALAAYRADHLAFPGRLELLAPKYIPKIEPPSGNQSWIYNTYDNGQKYKLGFKANTSAGTECWYDSKEFYWTCE